MVVRFLAPWRVENMETATAVIAALERAPSVVVPLVREVPAATLKRRPAPNKWSAHEHACHLAVVHRLFFDRLDQILASPSPIITPYDPGHLPATEDRWPVPLIGRLPCCSASSSTGRTARRRGCSTVATSGCFGPWTS